MLRFFCFFFTIHFQIFDLVSVFCTLPSCTWNHWRACDFTEISYCVFYPFYTLGYFVILLLVTLFILFFFNQTSILSGALFFHRIDSQRVYLLVPSVHESLLSSSPSPSGVCFPSWGLQTLYLPPWHCPPPPHSPAVPFSRLELTVAMPPGKLLSLLLHEKTPVPHSPSTLCPG